MYQYYFNTSAPTNAASIKIGTTTTDIGGWWDGLGVWHPNNSYSYWPTTIYMYQADCPKCNTKNWGELDHIIRCSKCSSTIKLVTDVVDYQVKINK